MGNLKYCVHPFAWTGRWSNQTLNLIDRAQGLGFELIEIPLLELDLVDPKKIRERLEAFGLGACASTACPEDADPSGETEEIRHRALLYLKQCVKATADMGATVFSGVTYSAMGRKIGGIPDQSYWDRVAKVLKEVARYAQDFGVTLGIEPINRYESFLINTGEQALRLREMIDEPNVGIHLDAYHMNIEETDFYEITRLAAPYLCHYHMSESHPTAVWPTPITRAWWGWSPSPKSLRRWWAAPASGARWRSPATSS
jgi:D-psicose/D-tagatose/L-ribulose 3-epimerase